MSHSTAPGGDVLPKQDESSMAAQDSDNTALESGLGSVGKPELEAESLVVD